MTNIILFLREEIVCVTALSFLVAYCLKTAHSAKDKHFIRIAFFAAVHALMDLITTYTVNNTDKIPFPLNKALHMMLIDTALLYTTEMFTYIFSAAYSRRSLKKIRLVTYGIALLDIVITPFLPINYIQGEVTAYTAGLSVYAGFFLSFIFIGSSMIIIVLRRRVMNKGFIQLLLPAQITMTGVLVYQIFYPELLATGGCGTIMTFAMFFALQNPVDTYRQRAYTDLVTGVRNKNSYEEDQKRFEKSDEKIGIVIFDLNNLKVVNDNFGHVLGDDFIITSAHAISEQMKTAWRIYRIGGDEFAAIYRQPDEKIVEFEMTQLQLAVRDIGNYKDYPFGIAYGYSEGNLGEEKFEAIMNRADEKMYIKKKELKVNRE
ncbi:MAG: GGDEF domain-containing protein [Lachnospiraceae bacterium]|nr:GGDEF domain-containing protein [Lachnospiraceae bacterium]